MIKFCHPPFPDTSVADKAQAIRGLIQTCRLSEDAKYLESAADAFESLTKEYDGAHGIFTGQNEYTIDPVDNVLEALNILQRFGGQAVDQTVIEQMLNGFYESVVNNSGLQLSAPPVGMFKGEFVTKFPELFYRYPTMPMPPMAEEPPGIAPVFVSEVTFDLAKESGR